MIEATPAPDGDLKVMALEALSDNYVWVLLKDTTHEAVIVDPGEARPVIDWLESDQGQAYRLAGILVTHHHQDHIGGVAELVSRYSVKVTGPHQCAGVNVDSPVGEGDIIDVLGHSTRVMETPGHTLDHIVYLVDAATPLLLCGDTLFHAGCGRLFEGSPAQMQENFARLAQLPEHTLVYGAHEYTMANLRFAAQVEPDNQDISRDADAMQARREANEPTLPSTIGKELAVNPFMRYEAPTVVQALEAKSGQVPADNTEAFALLRQWKDNA